MEHRTVVCLTEPYEERGVLTTVGCLRVCYNISCWGYSMSFFS